jgi:type II secretory ATPase GspE/PulE/Tfp pilus assembly ATPase PilB-like protein
MTIEDPVEYQLEGLNQIQINTKAGLTFAAGLRTILRSDPDVLLVGEIRDAETARIAVQAAMTGHLVLSTLHADNVGTAVSRLVDMGVERQLLASTVNCILAQRLARRLCPACREPYEATADELVETGLDAASVPDSGRLVLYRAKGCGQCHGGYKGRLGLFETLAATPKVRHLVETSTAEQIYAAAVADGMRTLQADGVRLALEGLTSLDEVRRVAGERRI